MDRENHGLFRRRLQTAASAAIALIIVGLAHAPAAFATSGPTAGGAPVASGVEYRLPFEAGQAFAVTQGWNTSFSHNGLSAYAYDFALPEGTSVVAAAAGVVAFVEDGFHACGDASLLDAANSVTINHADGTATLYSHLSAVSVAVGDVVTSGEELGLSGKTGFTNCQAHLHFAHQAQGRAVTQSIPIYFAELGDREIRTGAVVTSANPVCSQTTSGLPDDAFCAIYPTKGVLGDVQEVRLERTIKIGSPASTASHPAVPRSAAVSASWLGRFTFTNTGTYMFTATADRDVRLSIDGTVVLEGSAKKSSPRRYAVSQWLPAGQHVILVEYRSGRSPLLRFDWQEIEPAPQVRSAY
jgi:murein DD-endopeptidase MepM/ murein hydrolase activator NlpD